MQRLQRLTPGEFAHGVWLETLRWCLSSAGQFYVTCERQRNRGGI
jgi:hypothetical protein